MPDTASTGASTGVDGLRGDVSGDVPAGLAMPSPAAMPASRWRRILGSSGLYVGSVVLGLLIWTAAAVLHAKGGLLPAPPAVVRTFGKALSDHSLLLNAWASLRRVLIGYGLGMVLAIPIGFAIGWYPPFGKVADPWVQFLRTLPGLAWIPIVILFLGIGETAKIWLIFFGSFLACLVAVAGGVRSLDRTMIRAARVLGANDRQLFLHIAVPATLPQIFVGMRIALGNAWATLVAAELIAAPTGLGEMMSTASQYFQVPTIIVAMISIGVLGLLMDRCIVLLERRFTSWQERRDG